MYPSAQQQFLTSQTFRQEPVYSQDPRESVAGAPARGEGGNLFITGSESIHRFRKTISAKQVGPIGKTRWCKPPSASLHPWLYSEFLRLGVLNRVSRVCPIVFRCFPSLFVYLNLCVDFSNLSSELVRSQSFYFYRRSAQGTSKESSAKRYPAGTVVEVHERLRPEW